MRVFLLLIVSLCLTACASRPEARNWAEHVALAATDIEVVAQTITYMCGNAQPDVPCRTNSVIPTSFRDDAKEQLSTGLDYLEGANNAIRANETLDVADGVGRTRSILSAIQREIAKYQLRRAENER